MNRKKLVTTLLLGALATAALLGTIVYRTASAAAPTYRNLGHLGGGRGLGGGCSNEELAEALGISVDELNAAYREATEAALDQAVEAGLITQAQADELLANGIAFPFGRHAWSWLSANGIDFEALLADALGVSVDRLREAYLQAYEAGVDQTVADGRITQEQADLMKGQNRLFSSESFRSAMQSAFEAAVQQAVEAGLITQAQAEQILANKTGLGSPGFRGFGGFGRHGGWGGRMPGFPSPVPPALTPADDA